MYQGKGNTIIHDKKDTLIVKRVPKKINSKSHHLELPRISKLVVATRLKTRSS